VAVRLCYDTSGLAGFRRWVVDLGLPAGLGLLAAPMRAGASTCATLACLRGYGFTRIKMHFNARDRGRARFRGRWSPYSHRPSVVRRVTCRKHLFEC